MSRRRDGPRARRGRGIPGRVATALAAALLTGPALLTGCADPSSGASDEPPPPHLTAAQLAAGAGHACLTGPGPVTVDWGGARNPILASSRAGLKDEAVMWAGGAWHLLFSSVTIDRALPDGVRWNVATATSRDLVHWSAPAPWPRQARVLGVASPDVVRAPAGGFLVTYQSDPGSSGPPATQSRLFYRSSPDLRTWSPPRPLAPALAPAPDDRMIDGALVWTGHQLLLGFKYSSPTQPAVFEIARSVTGTPKGPWRLVGRPDITVDGDTVENYEFVWLAGRWHLVATSNTLDQPWLFTLAGDPDQPTGWLRWTGGYPLTVPSEPFDSGAGVSGVDYEHANSAYICDATSQPGHPFYLFYAGSPELTRFGGWGHAAIGVARSTDLVHWQVPPG